MKKLISLLLVLCMAFSLMAMSVSADEATVPENDQAENFQDDLEFVYGSGIYDVTEDVDGYLEGNVTRGEYALYLARLLSDGAYKNISNDFDMPFTDMEGDTTEMAKAVAWCYENGLVAGYTDGNYYPDKAATREEICALLARAMMNGVMEAPTNVTPNITTLVDSDDISGYAVKYVEYCVQYGLIVGDTNGAFNPSEPMSTVHMAAVLNRYEHNETMAQNTTKFVLSVETGEGNGYATIAVNDAYIMQITLSELELDPSHIELGAAMYNVGSLGVGETGKSHSVTINLDDLDGTSPKLPDWMKETWDFQGANIDITINADGDQKVCTYEVSAERVAVSENVYDLVITFVPTDVEATRKAWHHLVNDDHLTIKDDHAEDDSKIVIVNGSSLQLGYEALCFEEIGGKNLVLDNFNNLSDLKQTIKDAVCVTEAPGSEPAIAATLITGTSLRVGQTEATLTRDVTLKIDGVNAELVNGYLSQIRNAANESTMALAKKLIGMLDAAVGAVDDAENVGIIINVADAVVAE